MNELSRDFLDIVDVVQNFICNFLEGYIPLDVVNEKGRKFLKMHQMHLEVFTYEPERSPLKDWLANLIENFRQISGGSLGMPQ